MYDLGTKLWMQPRRETCSMKVRYVMKGDDIKKTLSTRLVGFLTTLECGIDITNEGRGHKWFVVGICLRQIPFPHALHRSS